MKALSGIQPSGELHLGNYFGAIRQYLRMQQEHDCFFFVANYHALTSLRDADRLRKLPEVRLPRDQVGARFPVRENEVLVTGVDPGKARQQGTSLNQLIRDYLERFSDSRRDLSMANEFRGLALDKGGRSAPGFRFDREEAHARR